MSRDRSKYYGSRFIHVGVIFQNPLPGEVLVIAAPLIAIRLGNAEWSNYGFEIWLFKWPELLWSFPDYSDTCKQVVCRRQPWQRLRVLIVYRALGFYSLSEYSRLLANRLSFGWQRFVARIIARVPSWIANRFMRIYAKMRQDQVFAYILRNSRFSNKE